ncbi:MAG: type II toxin-antitoxin system RelB/DinJ family antitoxin [Fusobacteriales bacterium]|jgi:DNA-damage-inducible protein J|nr:type II toxin-antitoxin system RelB/DinJ family antitoxin [Fusobacteriales bacterium]
MNSMKQTGIKKGKTSKNPKTINESIHVVIDGKTKSLAQETLENLGLDMSTAIRIYLKKIISERAIPFEISEDPFYSKPNLDFLKKSIKEAKEGKTRRMTLEQLESLSVDSDED